MRTLTPAPPSRVIAAEPVWALARTLLEDARAQRDPVHAASLADMAERIAAAVEAGTTLQDLTTEEASVLLNMKPESVATACRRGKIPGARKDVGTWRIPLASIGRAA